MPLYAYIKIHGISGSESLDEHYKTEWIPISSINLSNSGKDDTGEDSKDKKDKKNDPKTQQAPSAADKNKPSTTAATTGTQWRKPAEAHGTLTVNKAIDATSPKLQKLCLDCRNLDPDKYLEDKIQIHVCRHVPNEGEGDNATVIQIYQAYILENCLITNMKISGSESQKLSEEITITYETIYTFVRNVDSKDSKDGWLSMGWSYVDEKKTAKIPDPPEVPGTKPKPKPAK